MNRAALKSQIIDLLGSRRLVWVGTRGDDVEAVTDLPNLDAAFSIISAYRGRSAVQAIALEDLTGVRVDLDTYEIDEEPRNEALLAFRRQLAGCLSAPSAVFTYRPSSLVSSVCFEKWDRCEHLGLFKDHQVAFEHKPWVETSVARLGIPRVTWSYISDEEQLEAARFLEGGPVILRRSHSSGGTGLTMVDGVDQLADRWPHEVDAYVSVAPYIDHAVPLNVGAVVWRDAVTVHPASIQLIGVPGLTARQFGYCGNDFGAVVDLDDRVLTSVHDSTVAVGAWLRSCGYLGAYGVDFLVTDDRALFLEVNPRLQGSTHASCQISVASDESCILLEHLAAHLGLSPDTTDKRSLREMAAPLAHFVVHHLGEASTPAKPGPGIDLARDPTLEVQRVDVRVPPTVTTSPGATIARVTVRRRLVSADGQVQDPWRSVFRRMDPASIAESRRG